MTRELPQDQGAAERYRRMRASFEDAAPSDGDVLIRMVQARASRRTVRFLPRRSAPAVWGALVGVLACGSALAYGVHTGSVRLFTKKSDAVQGPAVLEQPESAQGTKKRRAAAGQQDALPANSDNQREDSIDPSEAALPEAGVSTQQRPEPAPGTPAGRSHDSIQGASRTGPLSAEESSTSWAKVAESLREGNDQAASEELGALSRSNSQAERDAAVLLGLQIKLEKQRASFKDVQSLKALARDGATPSVRDSARRLLNKLIRE